MRKVNASEREYEIILKSESCQSIYPFIKDYQGSQAMYQPTPHHGRSFVVDRRYDRFIVSKGNGLGYSRYTFLNSREFGNDTWGLLLEKDAIRDYHLGQDISKLGIKTNVMECVIRIENDITLPNGATIKPSLLQYSVECPYRICDTAYMTRQELEKQITQWGKDNQSGFKDFYLIASDILIRNLKTLHENNVLHNAIHPQNYTWALELLDFELACSPCHPYDSIEDQRHVKDLLPREIIQTYDVINHIAWSIGEEPNYSILDELFYNYGFDLSEFSLSD